MRGIVPRPGRGVEVDLGFEGAGVDVAVVVAGQFEAEETKSRWRPSALTRAVPVVGG